MKIVRERILIQVENVDDKEKKKVLFQLKDND